MGISPDFDIRPDKKLYGSSDHSEGVLTTLPANNRPQVDALTNILSALLR
jgi:hypothetical protein